MAMDRSKRGVKLLEPNWMAKVRMLKTKPVKTSMPDAIADNVVCAALGL
jgi:hypothetical protein